MIRLSPISTSTNLAFGVSRIAQRGEQPKRGQEQEYTDPSTGIRMIENGRVQIDHLKTLQRKVKLSRKSKGEYQRIANSGMGSKGHRDIWIPNIQLRADARSALTHYKEELAKTAPARDVERRKRLHRAIPNSTPTAS